MSMHQPFIHVIMCYYSDSTISAHDENFGRDLYRQCYIIEHSLLLLATLGSIFTLPGDTHKIVTDVFIIVTVVKSSHYKCISVMAK